ncbi:MAG: hypothetical protein ACE37F_37135 [Nannocystaceae bacterium]|nr:hypothetical protein [bacterium]
MPRAIETTDRSAYYTAALQLLRFVEARAPSNRRFGTDADALWSTFAGGLKTCDRIDTLLRDADVQWPGAFGARSTFGLRAVAEDDAYGADWTSLDPMDGEKTWKTAGQGDAPSSPAEAIAALEAAWERSSSAVPMPNVGPTTKLVLGGLSAVVSAIHLFAQDDALSWPEQVTVVADAPAERQVAAAAAALLNETKPTALRLSDQRTAVVGATLVLSDDASDEVRTAAEEIAAG